MLRLRQDMLLFPEGKSKAFTMSYDDGVSQDEQLISLLDKYGIKGTFNISGGLMGEQDWLIQPGIDVSHYKFDKRRVKEVYDAHEIALHSFTHPNLSRLPSSTITYEIIEDKKYLEEIVKAPIRGMAYPFGAFNNLVKEIGKQCGLIYGRTIKETECFELPADFMQWNPTCHHNNPRLEELMEDFIDYNQKGESEALLFYIWGHAYELENDKSWNRIEKVLKEIGFWKDIWYASNVEICEYILEAKRLIYSATGAYIKNPGNMDIWMQIDGITYCIPSGKVIEVHTV